MCHRRRGEGEGARWWGEGEGEEEEGAKWWKATGVIITYHLLVDLQLLPSPQWHVDLVQGLVLLS